MCLYRARLDDVECFPGSSVLGVDFFAVRWVVLFGGLVWHELKAECKAKTWKSPSLLPSPSPLTSPSLTLLVKLCGEQEKRGGGKVLGEGGLMAGIYLMEGRGREGG